MPVTQQVTVRITQKERFKFEVDWALPSAVKGVIDEPPPIGSGEGPNAARLVAVAVAHCLSSSLLFCIEKSHGKSEGIETTAVAELQRNEKGRWRLGKISVTLDPKVPAEFRDNLERCKGLFEDYCIVTESVRKGIQVDVQWAGKPDPAPAQPA